MATKDYIADKPMQIDTNTKVTRLNEWTKRLPKRIYGVASIPANNSLIILEVDGTGTFTDITFKGTNSSSSYKIEIFIDNELIISQLSGSISQRLFASRQNLLPGGDRVYFNSPRLNAFASVLYTNLTTLPSLPYIGSSVSDPDNRVLDYPIRFEENLKIVFTNYESVDRNIDYNIGYLIG